MSVGNVKEVDWCSFDFIMFYCIFSFFVDLELEKEQWLEVMQGVVVEVLFILEVVECVWVVVFNRFCVDCGVFQFDWVFINFCVVICKCCVGEYCGLGVGIFKVWSLKMDRKVWIEIFIEFFLQFGNGIGNCFWVVNVFFSEVLQFSSSFSIWWCYLEVKYCEGKYCCYYLFFGNQEELDKVLCVVVIIIDLVEIQVFLGCGVGINCFLGDFEVFMFLVFVEQVGQILQMEFFWNNWIIEVFWLDLMKFLEKYYLVILLIVSYSGFFYKIVFVGKLLQDCWVWEEFSWCWCVFSDGVLSYYENEWVVIFNGEIWVSEIVCLVVFFFDIYGFEYIFEVYIEGEWLYLFGLESMEQVYEWVKCIVKVFVFFLVEDLLVWDFEWFGCLFYKVGLSLQWVQEGWFFFSGLEFCVVFLEGFCEELL